MRMPRFTADPIVSPAAGRGCGCVVHDDHDGTIRLARILYRDDDEPSCPAETHMPPGEPDVTSDRRAE